MTTTAQSLAAAISRWLDGRHTRSLQMLARLSSVSYSTVRRVAQGEVDPSQEVAIAIASIIMPEAELRDFVGSRWPALKRFVVNVSYRTTEDDLARFLHSEEHLKVLVLASYVHGVDEKDVVEAFGQGLLPYFEDVVASGVLTRKGDKWILDQDVGSSSFAHARRTLATFISMCSRKNDELKGASAAYVGWESLNKEAALKLADLEAKFCEDAFAIIGDKSNRGDVLVFFGTLFNILKGQERLI
ncbi:MAG TPA: helix-turn-helix transcriptional regulator [Oligoflexus sp.]|uniref:helix-turn-helix transcriptional regulator n=1 Tax=Oligoflexus sp. TaxID=1971216 RepID=UPI002D450026|nr:helix-turn-helix transcriptional regulator [Oligoflexus sp.]HYX39277.1 helix-turn-helix transcriptional regulator [Oligoflexus sp.]